MSKHHQPKVFKEDLDDAAVLELMAALSALMAHPSWDLWESSIRERRDGAMEDLAEAPADKVAYCQGYVAALGYVLRLPSNVLALAEEAQKRLVGTPKENPVRLPTDYDDDDPVG